MSDSNRLPAVLQQSIQSLDKREQISLQNLRAASTDLSKSYRHFEFDCTLQNQADMISYLNVRLPATYAVVHHVLKMIPNCDGIESLLDLGTGPGTTLWAALDLFTNLKAITALERNVQMMTVAQSLMSERSNQQDLENHTINWRLSDLNALMSWPQSDMVSMSYALGEQSDDQQAQVLMKMYQAAKHYIVIVEPGTPQGFQNILKARTFFIDAGAAIVAPCTHTQMCPILGNDWCHFSKRINRSRAHQQIKQATLPFEDEKYSYLIVQKSHDLQNSYARIVKKPQQRSGHVRIDLCHEKGLEQVIYSRKHSAYRTAKSAKWGDLWLI